MARRRQGRHGLPVRRHEGRALVSPPADGCCDMVPGVPPDEREATIARLSEELTRVRAELADVRREGEQSGTRLARIRAARKRAERTAVVLSEALAVRLRLDIARKSADRRLLTRLQQELPTPDEAEQLELLRT